MLFLSWFPKEMRLLVSVLSGGCLSLTVLALHLQPGLQLLKLLAFSLQLTTGEEIAITLKYCYSQQKQQLERAERLSLLLPLFEILQYKLGIHLFCLTSQQPCKHSHNSRIISPPHQPQYVLSPSWLCRGKRRRVENMKRSWSYTWRTRGDEGV